LGKSTPKTPDPVQVSAAQTQSNKDTAGYNAALGRVDQSSPFGSVNYTNNGTDPATGAPLYSQQTTLSPQLQGLFDSQVGSQQGISDAITGAIGRLPSLGFDASGINTDNIAKASYDKGIAQMTPQWEEGARNLQGTMSDRGIPIGSEIWGNEQNRYDTAKNTSMEQISRQSQLDAGNEHQRQYGNAVNEYNMPYQSLAALMGNSQAVGSPQFSGVPQAQAAGTNTSQNTWDAYNANLNKTNASNSNTAEGVMAAAKLAMMFSDRRLKRDIKRIGAMPSGLPVYSYKYTFSDEPQIGVMADEAMQFFPDAVTMHHSGYLQVHYSKIA
jgi:hypothetical protein